MVAEYVYAVHEFLPPNDDEIDFEVGERIEMIDKDDLCGDGWWAVSRLHSVRIIDTASASNSGEQGIRSSRRQQGGHGGDDDGHPSCHSPGRPKTER